MSPLPRVFLLCVSLPLALAARAAERPPEETAVARVLDDWHDAAAKADETRYFAHFAKGGVFLGTDAAERWDVAAFRAYAHPYFARGKAWSFRAKTRHVIVAGDGKTAWFDELLDTPNLGEARGSGVLVKEGGGWKVALYDLSIPIPNDLAKEVVARIARVAPAPGGAPGPSPTPSR
jgi:hypothetical protein